MTTHLLLSNIRLVTILTTSAMACAANVQAGTITYWNTDTVDLASEPFELDQQYANIIYWDATKTEVRGDLVWRHGDLRNPGLRVITGASPSDPNCVMAAGINPITNSNKSCSDPENTNKHYEIRASVLDSSEIALVFNVAAQATPTTYKFYQTFTNNSNDPTLRLDKLRIRLGFNTGSNFVTSTSTNDGLEFARADGTTYVGTRINATPSLINDFWASIPTHLFGAGSGFFDNTAIATTTTAKINNQEIQLYTIGANYANLFGGWLPLSKVPFGYYFDTDDNRSTPDRLTGYWDGFNWRDSTNAIVPQSTVFSWEENSLYYIEPITDLARMVTHFHVNVGDISTWPTYDAQTETATFTLFARVQPTTDASTPWADNPFPAIIPAPVATNDTYSLSNSALPLEVTNTNQGLLANDSAASNGSLTVTLVDLPTRGTLTMNPNGTFSYTAGTNYAGVDTFTYTANDGRKDSNIATVTISGGVVTPIAIDDTYALTDLTTPLNVSQASLGVIANDSAPSGGTLVATLVSSTSSGTLSFNADGTFLYTAFANYPGKDSFTYRVNDGFKDSNVGTVRITGGAKIPFAADDSYILGNKAWPLRITNVGEGVLINDSAPSNGQLTAVIVDQPATGSVKLELNGTFTYTAGNNYNGSDSFTYIAKENFIESNKATVRITGGVGGTGGGCAATQGSLAARAQQWDPMLPMLAVGSIGLLLRRRRNK